MVMRDKLSLEDHAVLWWVRRGVEIPPLDSPAWEEMYRQWVEYAFMRFRGGGGE